MPAITPESIIALLIVLGISFPIHEFAHAWTADYFGDDTPRMEGRLTLNPLAHLDPMGTLMIVSASLGGAGGLGWAKPVPVNPYALLRRSALAPMLVSLAGPFSNFLMAVLGAIPIRILLANPALIDNLDVQIFVLHLLETFMVINLSLMLFNLIPIAPLDGSKIAVSVLPESWAKVVEQISAYGPVILMLVVFMGPRLGIDFFGWIINPVLFKLELLLIGV